MLGEAKPFQPLPSASPRPARPGKSAGKVEGVGREEQEQNWVEGEGQIRSGRSVGWATTTPDPIPQCTSIQIFARYLASTGPSRSPCTAKGYAHVGEQDADIAILVVLRQWEGERIRLGPQLLHSLNRCR